MHDSIILKLSFECSVPLGHSISECNMVHNYAKQLQ
jgi:hypothetical protein